MNTELPIAESRSRIVSAVAANAVTIITAETGAGKSTQVPQYLLKEGYSIVVTQPRRLAARTVAERVAYEWGCEFGQEIGFRTAHERCDSPKTRCLFCTDGLALVRELVGDKRIKVLVIDEVHEWNLNIEVLVAWVKKQIEGGRNLKVVLMSATLEAEKLSAYFGRAPIISVPGRIYPVLESETHQRGLVHHVAELIRKRKNVLVFQPGKKEISDTIKELKELGVNAEVLPLHGELDSADQTKCFRSYARPKVIVATNVAQTSVTIPDIDAVVDCGEERRVETVDGVEGLYLCPISLADSLQRQGRAGRTKSGEYADYCPEINRPEFPVAEILRLRLDQVVLRLAEAGFDAEELTFFHQPDIKNIHEAKKVLKALGCITSRGSVTRMGSEVARLPISVRCGRMIVEAIRYGVVDDVVTIAAILEGGDLQMRKDKEGRRIDDWHWRRLVLNERESDALAQLTLYKEACEMTNAQMEANAIHPKAFYRAKEIRAHLVGALRGRIHWSNSFDRTRICRAVVSGLVDCLYENTMIGYVNGDNCARELHRGSVFQYKPKWIVGEPRDIQIPTEHNGPKTLNLVTMVTAVSPELLMDLAPHLISTKIGVNPRFDAVMGEVVTSTETYFGSKKISEEIVVTRDVPNERELIRDGLLAQFVADRSLWPTSMVHVDSYAMHLEEIPGVVTHHFGEHPRTKEKFIAYGTFRFEGCWIGPFWTLSDKVAREERNALVTRHAEVLREKELARVQQTAIRQRPATADGINSLAAAWGVPLNKK